MQPSSRNLLGVVLMVTATGVFLANDTLLKLATSRIPPLESLFLRALTAVIIGIPLLAGSGMLKQARLVFNRAVLLRNLFEFVAASGYIFALAYAPIADIAALSQLSPMLVLVGAMVMFGDRIGRFTVGLVIIACIGAVLVAQPGGSGFQPFALLGLWNAVASAARDLLGRRVHAHVPALVVAVGASVVSLVGIGVLTFLFEPWVTPDGYELALIAGSGALLTLGQMLLFLAYRVAETKAVVPFQYTAALWALLIGVLVFGTLPNGLALVGIGLILVAGVLAIVFERRASRVVPVTA